MREECKKNIRAFLILLSAMFVASLFGILMTGCVTKHIVEMPVPMVTHDTLRTVMTRTDSIHVTDSIVVRGDTVEKWHIHYVQRTTHDTVFQHRADTVTVVKTVEKEVRRKGLNWLEGVGFAAIAAAVAWLLMKTRRFI